MSEQDDDRPELILLGSGIYAQTRADTVKLYPVPWRVAGFAQNVDSSRRGETQDGLPVYTLDELPELAGTYFAQCCLGDCDSKRRFVEQVEPMGFCFLSTFAPGSRLVCPESIGDGSYVGYDSIVWSGARLGRHVTILSQCNIGEGIEMGDFSFAGGGSLIAGGAKVGAGTFVGTGAIVTERVTVGSGVIVGAGAVVVKDVPDGAVVVGNPARRIERKGGPLKPSA